MEDQVFCDQKAVLILKFIGVFPQGLNRLHDAIARLNRGPVFVGCLQDEEIRILRSEFVREPMGYIVEIRVPYKLHYHPKKVPQSIIMELFEAIDEFQPG